MPSTPRSQVAAWNTCTDSASSAATESRPVISRRPLAVAGYPSEAITTFTAHLSCHSNAGISANFPVAAACKTPASGVRNRAKTTCVSGSPNRALNSMTRGPLDVSASPQYTTPTNGVPRRRISSTVGWATCATTCSTRFAGAHGRGEYAPIPPVFGPASLSKARLKSWAGSSGTTVTPSVIQNSETSGPSKNSSTTILPPGLARHSAAWASASSRSEVTTTPLPAASPSSLTTCGAPNSSSAAATSSTVKHTRESPVGTFAAAMISFAKALEPSRAAAACVGPKAGIPRFWTASLTPATSGASGPITTRSAFKLTARSPIASGAFWSTAWRVASSPMPGLPGAAWSSVTAESECSAAASACSRAPPPTRRIFTYFSLSRGAPRPAWAQRQSVPRGFLRAREQRGRVAGSSAAASRHGMSADADISEHVLFFRAPRPEQTDTGQYQEQSDRDCRQDLGTRTGEPYRRLPVARVVRVNRIGVKRVDHVHHIVGLGVIQRQLE